MSTFLEKKIAKNTANIAVLGLGYVGLPLAISFAKKGFNVFGLDTNLDRINRINRGQSYISDIKSKEIQDVVARKRLSAQTDFSILKTIDVIIICVPTPLKRKYTPDIQYIIQAVDTIGEYLKKDTLIVLESTTYPGTTEELIKPRLEKKGLKAEKDFYLAFSPERIDPGNKQYDVSRIPKIVGGLSSKSTHLAQKLYEKIIVKVYPVSSAKTAEMTKLLENSFRIINIGWINEVAMMCHKMGLDVWEVIDAAKTKPFGFMPFYPGLGVGGHCIPDDPLYLYWKAKHHGFSSKFIKLAADVNSNMPLFAIGRIKEILALRRKTLAQAKILIVGVTYKKDVKDLRKSPPLKLIELLKSRKSKVDYYDPIIPFLKIEDIQMEPIMLTQATLKKYDCVVIAMDHSAIDYDLILKHAKTIYDVRRVYKSSKDKKVFSL